MFKSAKYAMNPLSSPENSILILDRFNGIEGYPIELAEWNLYRNKESGLMNLWICLRAGKAIFQQEDTQYLNAQPNWELNLVDANISESSIKAGFNATIPECYDESKDGWITVMYFCDHQGTDRNSIEIVEVDGSRVRFRLRGDTTDVNYYNGSKPETKLSVDTWFERNHNGIRSMSWC